MSQTLGKKSGSNGVYLLALAFLNGCSGEQNTSATATPVMQPEAGQGQHVGPDCIEIVAAKENLNFDGTILQGPSEVRKTIEGKRLSPISEQIPFHEEFSVDGQWTGWRGGSAIRMSWGDWTVADGKLVVTDQTGNQDSRAIALDKGGRIEMRRPSFWDTDDNLVVYYVGKVGCWVFVSPNSAPA